MRIPRLKLSLAAALAVVGLTAAVAIAAPSGGSPIEQAATKSSTASSVKFDFVVSISGGGSSIPGGKISLGGSGVVDSQHKTADFKLDLSSLAPLLRGALSVHKLGSDAHGTHYHGSLDLSALVSLVPKAQQASMKASLAKAGISKLPFDAWVGKAGYLTRFVVSLSVKATKGQPAVKLGFAINLHDYNHRVSISAP